MTSIVPGDGPRNARIMLVGEAPASTEVRLGKPFQGRAGEELNSLLAAAGIQRDQCYITNASIEPVLGNKDDFFFKGGISPAFARGMQALLQDISEIQPNVIVPLGNYALFALRGHKEIMKWRGSLLWSDMVQRKIVPTLHPAALLRGKPDENEKAQGGLYKMRSAVVWDLQRAKKESFVPQLTYRPRDLWINPEGAKCDEAIHRLLTAKKIVTDIETFGGLDLACIGFSDGDPEWAVTWDYISNPEKRHAMFKYILESDVPKIGQNMMYDATMLDQIGIKMRNIQWDTLIASHVLMPDLPKSLAFLNSIYTDIPYYKEDGKVWKEGPNGPNLMQYYQYNARDICATAEIAQIQETELVERNLMSVFQRQMMVFDPLRKATHKGFAVNHETLWRFMQEHEGEYLKAQEDLNKLAGWEVNANSHIQVKKLLYEERNLAGKRTVLSTDAPTILDLAARTGDRAPYLIIKVREHRKLLSTYYKTDILSPDGRVRFGFNIAGTMGARLSSSAPLWGTGLNGQNIPGPARRMFIPDSGYTLLEFDQSQAEAVIVAYLANDPVHIDCFRHNKDVHRVTACLLTGMPTEQWAAIPKSEPIRDLAKTCNHALNYNMGPIQLMRTVNELYNPEKPGSIKLDQRTATDIRNRYLETRPALPAYWESIRAELRNNNRTLRTPLGFEYQFLDHWSDQLLNKAYSYKPQCTIGDTNNIGICQVLGLRPSDLVLNWKQETAELQRMGLEFLLQVHDSTVWQIPTEAVEEAWPKIMRLLEVPIMVNGYPIVVPIEGTAGPTWYKKDMRELGKSRKTCEVGWE